MNVLVRVCVCVCVCVYLTHCKTEQCERWSDNVDPGEGSYTTKLPMLHCSPPT